MNIRRVFTLVGVVGIGLFVYAFWADLAESVRIIRGVQWQYLLLAIPILFLVYLIYAAFYKAILKTLNTPQVSLWRLYGLTLASAFVNTILPSGGASGVSFLATVLRRDGINGGQTSFMQIARYMAVYTSYTLLLVVAIISLYMGDIGRLATIIAIAIAVNIIIVTVLGIYILYNKRAFNWFFMQLRRLVDFIARRFRRGEDLIGVKRMAKILGNFHSSAARAVQQRTYLKQPLWYGLAVNVLEVWLLYIVFVALGNPVSIGIVIIAFAVANGAGIVTVIPGDVGVYEIAMVAALSIVGVPLAVGISATLVYRVLHRGLMLPFGFYFYNRYLKEVT
ncbi:MAG: lysylphosphatidylglycerol synthase transmembrane domain-containing protein [Candidatus Saccharimonadales bacterium]